MIGKTISHYKIISKLGEGGMGIVYKAQDTKLDREVALKFLPTNAITSQEEKTRFEQEAKAAAKLSHANIAHVYEINEHEGKIFIAMEYIDGETLAEKVARGPLKLDEAIGIATQIAAGLQAAHQKKITHRDIKSANIMVTKDGSAKVMDFGLAKLSGRTMVTKEGTTLGTASYMSPEQARGEAADHRSDIWSIGVVLYEMICGQLPFKGDYEQAVVYGILNEDPEALTALRTGVPMAMDGIIAKALAKDRDIRYQNVEELPADLKAIDVSSIRHSRIGTLSYASMPQAVTSGPRKVLIPWILAAVFLVISIGLLIFQLGTKTPSQQVVRTSLLPPDGGAFATGDWNSRTIAFSPDGTSAVFVARDSTGRNHLWLRRLDSAVPQQLAGTQGAYAPFWSPNSQAVAFFDRKELKRVDVSTGQIYKICNLPSVRGGAGGTWNREGTILIGISSSQGGIYRISPTGVEAVALIRPDSVGQNTFYAWPHFLPDGRHFLYTLNRGFGFTSNLGLLESDFIVYVASLDGRINKQLFESRARVIYKNGLLIYQRGSTLMARPFDSRSLELKGDPVAIASEVTESSFDVSGNQMLAFQASSAQSGSQLLWFDQAGNRLSNVGGRALIEDIILSPDEKNILMAQTDEQTGSADIWVFELQRGVSRKLTFGQSNDDDPIWAPGGDRIAFASDGDIYVKKLRGDDRGQLLVESDGDKVPLDWSHDGRFILYLEGPSGAGRDLWIMPLAGDRDAFPYLDTDFVKEHGQFSPNGDWVAYSSNESADYEVYINSFPDPGIQHKISINGGIMPKWSQDGTKLFFVDLAGKLMVVTIDGTPQSLTIGSPEFLFDTNISHLNNPRHDYDVSANGQRFLVNSRMQNSMPYTLIFNWAEELGLN